MAAALNPERIKQAEFTRQVHSVVVDEHTSIEQMLVPDFWVHVAGKLHVGDKIEVTSDDNSLYAELLVRSCSRLHAKVHVLDAHIFKEMVKKEGKDKPPFYLAFKGAVNKHAVIRTSDKEVVKMGFDTSDEAKKWLEENIADLTK